MKKKLLLSLFVSLCIMSMTACDIKITNKNDASRKETTASTDVKEDTKSDTSKASSESKVEKETSLSEETTEGKDELEVSTEEKTELEVSTEEKTELEASTEEIKTDTAETENESVVETTILETSVEEKDNKQTNNNVSLSEDLYSFQISIDGTVYQLPMLFEDMKALGWEYQDTENAEQLLKSNQYTFSNVLENGDIQISSQFANFSMNSVKIIDSAVVSISVDKYGLNDSNAEIVLPKNIQYGKSGKDDIIAAYGDPTDTYEGELYYKLTYQKDSYQDIELYVYKESGVLEEVRVRNMVPIEGLDNSVSDEVPASVKSYVAPTELGNDLYQFNIELNSKLYHFPCPLSVLIADGFQFECDDDAIAAGDTGWIELRKNNQTMRTMIENYSHNATIPENCFVISLECENDLSEFHFTTPCNLTIGDSEDDLLKALEGLNYETDESNEIKYYTVFDKDKSSVFESFEFKVIDGKIDAIEVSNDSGIEY